MSTAATLIHRYVFDTRELEAAFPPEFSHPNKRAVYALASKNGARAGGNLTFSRWAAPDLSEAFIQRDSSTRIVEREGYFRYEAPATGHIDWHMNFAHHDLFCAYGGPLFAQDEMQVTEHPGLASLRKALLHRGIPARCVEHGRPTPALIAGVARRCRVHTGPEPAAGRPHGLYGNAFAAAPVAVVERATEVLDPPTVSNILAMEAPSGGVGPYGVEEIGYTLTTAITGYSAAVAESRSLGFEASEVAIHTGYWGCGAYGGNPVLMLLLQMAAAHYSGVGALIIYLGPHGRGHYLEAARHMQGLLPVGAPRSLTGLVKAVASMNFPWGVSNGT